MTDNVNLNSKEWSRPRLKPRQRFWNYVPEKSLAAITIKELTALARINRSTFYAHYTDIYHLREQILEGFVLSLQQQVASAIFGLANGDEFGENIVALTDFYDENIALFRAFIGKNFDPQLRERLQTIAKSFIFKSIGKTEPNQSELLSYLLEYAAAGHLALISKWVNSEAQVPAEELVGLIKSINLEGPITYLLKEIRS